MTLERRRLLDREVQSSNDATRVVELPRSGHLSALRLRLECTNGGTSGTEELIDAIDRIEVIGNGSEVIFSLTGVELYRWQYVWGKRRPPIIRTMRLSVAQEVSLLVPFGRFIGDPNAYLDLNKWNRVELRIQFSPTISGTTFTTGTFTISVTEYSWREGMAPGPTLGYLRTTQVRDFTSAASGIEVVELARRYPYMGILVYAREAAIADGVDITEAELREDTGRVIPYTGRWVDIQMENQVMLDLVAEEFGVALRTDAGLIDTLVSQILAANVILEDDTGGGDATHPLGTIASITADRIALSVVEVDEAATQADSALASALYPIHWRAKGIGIGNAIWLPLARPGDLENPYPAPDVSKLELALTNGGAGATVRVSTQELVAA